MSGSPQSFVPARRHFTVSGVVEGVGFRPFVYALARRLELVGFVRNAPGGVEIEVEGCHDGLDSFALALRQEAPPLARLETVEIRELAPRGEASFRIEPTTHEGTALTPISPDVAVCDACLAELFDSTDRRYRYPFLNCTHCGPRFTVVEDVPYDRATTTMRFFPLCPACAAEYADPANRRFHAQPTACPDCGPQLSFVATDGRRAERDQAFGLAAAALAAGEVVAIKGLGGFHLACDATSEVAVARLRERKGRLAKPLAVMVANLEEARSLARVEATDAALLTARERPIVLLPKGSEGASRLAPSVAPRQQSVGLMLPYTPLHHLLMAEPVLTGRPLVMTSGNLSEEPIARENDETLERLAGIADAWLLHNRGICVVCDDSVVKTTPGGPMPIRRSRGYVPAPLALPRAAPSVLAVGGELKATFCLTAGRRAFLSQHIGDLLNLETQAAFERALDHLLRLFRIQPATVACDLHPGYLSTRWAETWAKARGLPLVRVQHHHAHIAALMAEHGLSGERPVIGVAFDGTGYGTDGTVWGGEVLLADYRGFERLAHLAPVPLAGGDAAVKRPARMALAHLWAAGIPWNEVLPPVAATAEAERRVLARQLETGFGTVPTSSMGRLFDAVAALLGVNFESAYEGQAAMELEALCLDEPRLDEPSSLPATNLMDFELREQGRGWVLDPAPLLSALVEELARGAATGLLASRFHDAVARVVLAVCQAARARHGVGTVALSGGTFQNVRLATCCEAVLRQAGFEPLLHTQVPPNDGGLSLGQAAVAAYRGQSS